MTNKQSKHFRVSWHGLPPLKSPGVCLSSMQTNLPIRLFLPYLSVARLSPRFISILQKIVEKGRCGNKGTLPAPLSRKHKSRDAEELVQTLQEENEARNNSLGSLKTPYTSFLCNFQWLSG